MSDAAQKTEPTARPAVTRADPFARVHRACRLVILFCALGIPATSQATESYSTIVSNHLALETEPSLDADHHSETNAEALQISDLKRAVLTEVEILSQAPQAAPAPKSQSSLMQTLGVTLTALLALGATAHLVRRKLDALASARAATEERTEALLFEEPGLGQFFRELRGGLTASAAAEAANAFDDLRPETNESNTEAAPDPLQEFFASVPGQIAGFRKLFSEISRATDQAAHQKVLAEFFNQLSGLKERSRLPELRPAWLLVCALEGLLKQLSSNPSEVTASVLGTVAGAVDLLETLCVRGLNPNLATEPPVRLLAVDDDPVSRLAISFALKKAFNAPDLAPDGETALRLIALQTYDVIFLDVDMPGMDGYELCTRIHQTAQHRTTPTVFVTRHGDFHSRAKSTLSGGEGLIAKPFLAFEITVKALTLALRARLEASQAEPCSTSQQAPSAIAATASELAAIVTPVTTPPTETPAATTAETNDQKGHSQTVISSDPSANGKAAWELSDSGFQALFKASRDGSPAAFFTRAPAYLEQLRHQLQAAQHEAEETRLQELLGRLHVGVKSLNVEAERAELRAASRLGAALEGLLKKLAANHRLCTPSTFNAAAAALELLEELCQHTGDQPDFANAPIRILVVDDDPVARRAMSMAIQLVFGRPDTAESGEAALALAAEQPYDLIFLDVLMPGMDGFATCKKIHETALNRRTPVMFVTGHDGLEARSLAVEAGGCGFIPKPVLPSQITLSALTLLLRARLKSSDPAPDREPAACLELA